MTSNRRDYQLKGDKEKKEDEVENDVGRIEGAMQSVSSSSFCFASSGTPFGVKWWSMERKGCGGGRTQDFYFN